MGFDAPLGASAHSGVPLVVGDRKNNNRIVGLAPFHVHVVFPVLRFNTDGRIA